MQKDLYWREKFIYSDEQYFHHSMNLVNNGSETLQRIIYYWNLINAIFIKDY